MERHDAAGRQLPEHRRPGRLAGRARRGAHLARVGPRGRQRHQRRVHPPGPDRRAAHGDDDRQRPARPARDRRHRRADEHGGGRGGGDQRQRRGEREARRGDATAATRAPASCSRARRSTCPTSSTRRRTATCRAGRSAYSVMRIGKKRDGSRTGVFLYCQQHAREWATPLTCLETAEQLLRNYAIDPQTRKLVDNLDIFILPSSNPDGAHYSIHNFNSQRRNLTNHCVEGGKETDDPNAASFWTPRVEPRAPGCRMSNSDPGSRNAWGVDLNRNNTFATLFDGYIGASFSCTSDVFAGPGRGVRAGDQERAVDRGQVHEHQVLEQHPQLRRLLHVGAGRVPAGPRRGRRGAREHRRREVLLRRRRPDPQPDQGGPQHGDPAGAHGPDRRRAVLGRRQQRRRALVQPRRHRVQLRDGRRPLRPDRAERGRRRRARPASGSPNRTWFDTGRQDHVRLRARPTRRSASSPTVVNPNPPSPAANIIAHASRWRWRTPAGAPVWPAGSTQVGVGFQPPVRDRGQVRGARVRGGQLRAARVGVRRTRATTRRRRSG